MDLASKAVLLSISAEILLDFMGNRSSAREKAMLVESVNLIVTAWDEEAMLSKSRKNYFIVVL